MNKFKNSIVITFLFVLLLSGCAVTTEKTKENELESIKTDTVHEAIGGDSKSEFSIPYDLSYYGIPVFVRDIVGDDKVDEWLSQFESDIKPDGRSKWELNVYNVVTELNIPKEEFNKANKGVSFSEEQIEAIYSMNIKKVNKAFVNKAALLMNDEIYTSAWLADQTAEDLKKIGITEDILEGYLEKIKDTPLKDDYEKIKIKINK